VQALERVVAEIVEAARRSLDLQRVILFGSRARGDARLDSDLDLAFDHSSTDAEWADFVNQMRDEAPTLLPLDLVDLAQADPALRARITSEGRLVHG
jgi:predicted nucleotidyltransferase